MAAEAGVESKAEVAIQAKLTFHVDVTIVHQMVLKAQQYRADVQVLPELLRALMLVAATLQLTGTQKHRLVMVVIAECTLVHVDPAAREQLVLMLESLIDTYYLLSKGAHVFQGAPTSVACFCV